MEAKCKKEASKWVTEIQAAQQEARNEIIRTYGFVADPSKTVTVNAITQIARLPPWLYYSRPQHMAFHNLTQNLRLPTNLKSLLGLGLNFCLREKALVGKKAIDYDRFRKNFFTKIFFAEEEQEIPPLFLQSKWEPPPSLIPIEARMATSFFFGQLKRNFVRRRSSDNLTIFQKAALRFLVTNPQLLIIKTDKNLGPAIIERHRYVQLAYAEHLSDHITYRRLTEDQAINRIRAVKRIITCFIQKFLNGRCNEHDKKYLVRSMGLFMEEWNKNQFPTFARFYMLAKVHKTPMKMRPIVSVSSCITDAIGRWVDKELQLLFNQH